MRNHLINSYTCMKILLKMLHPEMTIVDFFENLLSTTQNLDIASLKEQKGHLANSDDATGLNMMLQLIFHAMDYLEASRKTWFRITVNRHQSFPQQTTAHSNFFLGVACPCCENNMMDVFGGHVISCWTKLLNITTYETFCSGCIRLLI